MTDLITKLRADALEKRKIAAQDQEKRKVALAAGAPVPELDPMGIHAVLLGTVSAEAAIIGKNDGGRQPTDDEVIGVIRKFVKGLDATIAVARSDEERNRFLADKRALEVYLPRILDGGDLGDAINQTANDLGLKVEMRNTKLIVTALQEKFPGRIDAGSVARYIKSAV